MDKITPRENPEEFAELCGSHGIEYNSTVNRFEKDYMGVYRPVFWSEVDKQVSATERTLR